MRSLTMVVALAALGCGEARRVDTSDPFCPSYKEDLSATLTTRCARCHSGAEAAAGYDVTTYAGAIAEPGRGKLATVLDPASANATHRPFIDLYPLVQKWAVDCRVAYLRSSIHPGGILDPTSEDFHGKEVVRQGYRLETCASCHGSDFRGGLAGSDCTTCHTAPGGPTACTTCHGNPPMSGAHLAHATSPRLGRPQACAECHIVPDVYSAAGHVRTASGTVDEPPAEVTFGALAQTTLVAAARMGPPSFDRSSGACSNVYCHGDVFGDAAALHPRPTWMGGPAQASCGSCHGTPPSNHPPDLDCTRCHVTATAATHMNGVVDLGDPARGCTGCHGGPERPLSGAHRAHLEATHGLTAPIACAVCHRVPAERDSPGHIDSPAPAEVVFSGLATAQGATPVESDRGCAGVYCHGGGSSVVKWDATGGAAVCGSCHGVPPADGKHAATLGLHDCATCHGATVDAFGNIRFVGGVTTHINGRPDVALP